jgi:amino acid adenylation domain-containing protein
MSKPSEHFKDLRGNEAALERHFSHRRQAADALSHPPADGYSGLSFEQQQVWVLTELAPDLPVAHVCVTVHLPAPLEVDALAWSLNQIIQRHEVWRTVFPVIDGQPAPLILPEQRLSLPLMDLRPLPEAEREARGFRLATQEAQRLFDLAQGPLLRALLIQWDTSRYRLFLTLHRLIADEVSLSQLLLPELRAFYESSLGDPSVPLSPLPLQYADYVRWQQQELSENRCDEHVEYWKRQLKEAPVSLALPVDHPREAVPTVHGSMVRFAFSSRLTDALRSMSSKAQVRLETILVAAFQALLFRYTGQEDLLTQTVAQRRTHLALSSLMGLFRTPLVLRTKVSGNSTFRDLLRHVHEVMTSAQAHGDVPFEEVVKALRPEEQGNQQRLLQVEFAFVPASPDVSGDWSLSFLDVHAGTTPFDLALELYEQAEGLVGGFIFHSDLFDEPTIKRLARHWGILLESLVARPTERIGMLPLLTEIERHQVLLAGNALQTAFPSEQCVQQLVERQVQSTPDALAVVYEPDQLTYQQLTYQQLNRRANQLAHFLQQRGVGPNVLVGICVERSVEMVVGLLAILKAGGAYVPLDPTSPAERKAFILENSQASIVVTQHSLSRDLPLGEVQVVCLDTDKAEIAQQSEWNPTSANTADDLAYVIYTSSSTGHPKGVQILHRAVVNVFTSMRDQPGLFSEQDTWLAVTPLSCDRAVLELFLPLIVGACVVVASSEVVANGERLREALIHSYATVMQATPVTWDLLLAAGWQGNPRLKMLCGGEALPLSLARALRPMGASLWNMYGLTEATICSSICKIEPGDETISIGRPIANTQMYVLDSRQQLVPIGVPGELCIGGSGLARSYLNLPQLTEERFLPHPFRDEACARLYKTGDLARSRPDGTIELIGRADHQREIGGYRIELGAIEAVLSQHLAVRYCVVVVREEMPDENRLVAYLVLHHGQSTTEADLEEHARKLLPGSMVPSAFVLLDEFPLTPNGKIDRRALPVPDLLQRKEKESVVAPRSLWHCLLVQIWEDLLSV